MKTWYNDATTNFHTFRKPDESMDTPPPEHHARHAKLVLKAELYEIKDDGQAVLIVQAGNSNQYAIIAQDC